MLTGNPAVRLIENPENREHFGRALSFRARTGWDAAVATWSWVLNSWPDARIIFLNRDQGEIELRMLHSRQYKWIPRWGKCLGCCGGQVHHMLRSMADFCDLNPTRARLMEFGDLLDYDKAAAFLAGLDITLEREVWEREIAIKSYPTAIPKEEVIETDPAVDPFHPLATVETVDRLPGSRTPSVIADPLAEDAPWELADALPGPKKPDLRQIVSMPPPPKIRLDVARDHKAVDPQQTIVHTIRFGTPDWMGRCSSSLEGWCERHGYHLEVHGLPAEKLPSPKFMLVRLLKQFLESDRTRMVYVDADVVIHPSAPGWPAGLTGFCARVDPPGKPTKTWKKWMAKHRLRCPAGWDYRNSGVWSCDRDAAARFLEIIPEESEWRSGIQEQHQWNVWWAIAHAAGMQMRELPKEWNRIAGVETDLGWFYHLAGSKKRKILDRIHARNQLPVPPKPFQESPATVPLAMAWLWSGQRAEWDELRYSMRSALKHFEDVPFHIFGDQRPEWLADHPQVTFHLAPTYEEALAGALQCAEEVVLMNDDIYYLRRCSADDLRVALTRRKRGSLLRRLAMNLEASNSWLNGVADAVCSMVHHGYTETRDFSTHTPYLFERKKALATLRRHGLWRKIPFEVLYHNQHRTECRPVTGFKTTSFPYDGDPWFLNHGSGLPSQELREGIAAMFPDAAPWERPDVAPSLEPRTPSIRLCVATHGEDLVWVDKVHLPTVIYDAAGGRAGAVPVSNVGREAGQYLHHILLNYGNFAEYEIFLQGNPFDHNPGIIEDLDARKWVGQRVWPLAPEIHNADPQFHADHAAALAQTMGIEMPDNPRWVQGAMFAVSREALMSRPKIWWQRLYLAVTTDEYGPWAVERLWLHLLS